MGKFIVIDKDDWEKIAQEFNKEDLPQITELSIDESIVDRATNLTVIDSLEHEAMLIAGAYMKGATEQSLIEQMKAKDSPNWWETQAKQSSEVRGILLEKLENLYNKMAREFAKWCSINGYSYSDDAKEWYHKDFPNAISVHCNMWYSTEELFNQFTNQKQ